MLRLIAWLLVVLYLLLVLWLLSLTRLYKITNPMEKRKDYLTETTESSFRSRQLFMVALKTSLNNLETLTNEIDKLNFHMQKHNFLIFNWVFNVALGLHAIVPSDNWVKLFSVTELFSSHIPTLTNKFLVIWIALEFFSETFKSYKTIEFCINQNKNWVETDFSSSWEFCFENY